MALRIYNTLTRTKEKFVPLAAGVVKMYTCGQTVYNDIHVGNARFYVVFDAVRRFLAHSGYRVQFVQNFTDIDDKMIARAAEEGTSVEALAEHYIARTLEDLEKLNVLPATHTPRATREMPAIIAMIERLIARGAAYVRGGSVFFDTAAAGGYGKLSRKKPDELLAGARVEVDGEKNSPADFVLWKPAKEGEPSWESPWGGGRPGWHIECSAMIEKYLGATVDIHGGAADLIFPHHENEIAQSEAACCAPLANIWMHCGLLTVDHKKMSKSRGNFQTLREVAERFPYEVIRFYFLSVHYRMPLEFTDEALAAAARGLERLRNCSVALDDASGGDAGGSGSAAASGKKLFSGLCESRPEKSIFPAPLVPLTAPHVTAFFAAMNDDFNTADAISAVFEWVKTVNVALAGGGLSPQTAGVLREQLAQMCGLLGIPTQKKAAASTIDPAYIEEQITARQAARATKNFAEADRIRSELAARGILLEDTPDGVRWKLA